jgi:hypothetical protein
MTLMRTENRVPRVPDQSGIVSRVPFGDLHMTARQEQNYRPGQEWKTREWKSA